MRHRGHGHRLLLAIVLIFSVAPALQAHWKIDVAQRSWKVLDTTRFRVHYPEGYEELALAAAAFAEQGAERCEQVLEHRISRVVPIFLFSSHQDFSSNNIFPGLVGEGTGGFTDFLRHRVVVPFNGDYFRLRHVITHEIAHAYQFDLLRGENYGRYPLWLMEGMAEYIALGWDVSGESFVRDAVLHDRFPRLAELHGGRVSSGFAYYKAGQAVSLYIAEVHGERMIGRLLRELRAFGRIDHAIRSTFRQRAEDFDIAMHRWMRARYASLLKAPTDDPRLRRITFRYEDQKGFNIHPAISPDGKYVVYFTVDKIFPALVIRKMPGPLVKRRDVDEVRIVLRALRSSRYEEWHPFSVRISFTPDGKQVVLTTRDTGRQAIVWIDLESGNIVRSLRPPFDSIQFPALSPDSKRVAFVGVARGRADLYVMELADGALRRITSDDAHETTPAFSRGGGFLYYSTTRNGSEGAGSGREQRDIMRVAWRTSRAPQRLSDVPGSCSDAQPGLGGSLVLLCDFSGVANLYRLNNALRRRSPAVSSELLPLTRSPSGISYASVRVVKGDRKSREVIALAEYEEGANELRVLTPPFGSGVDMVEPIDPLSSDFRTFDMATYQPPTDGLSLSVPFRPFLADTGYEPVLKVEGPPFVLIAGSQGDSGGTSLAIFAFMQLADDTGDHRLRTFVNYQDQPTSLNADLQYVYQKYRLDFFVGAFSQSGSFPISSFLDLSFNNILYNPNFRVLDQRSTGVYSGVEYPLHRFAALHLSLEHGRDEKIFRQSEPEEREQEDIYRNYQQMNLGYRYDNAVYSLFGPLDGNSLAVGYSVPVRHDEGFRDLYAAALTYRFYHLFSNFGVFAFRAFAGQVSGRDAADYPYRIGGFYTLRGYDFLEFEGTHAGLVNIEYRFPFIRNLAFQFPGDWSIGTVRGILFLDAGAAFDEPRDFQGYDGSVGVTRDLHMSFGVGLHWVNFLYPILPGTIMKIEWATPYDTKRALPLSKWRGQFSLGFSFD